MIRVQSNDALSWQIELGRFCGTHESGCDTGASSGRCEGAGVGFGAGGSSGGDGQSQSGQMTVHMGDASSCEDASTMPLRGQRTVTALVDGLESLGC